MVYAGQLVKVSVLVILPVINSDEEAYLLTQQTKVTGMYSVQDSSFSHDACRGVSLNSHSLSKFDTQS